MKMPASISPETASMVTELRCGLDVAPIFVANKTGFFVSNETRRAFFIRFQSVGLKYVRTNSSGSSDAGKMPAVPRFIRCFMYAGLRQTMPSSPSKIVTVQKSESFLNSVFSASKTCCIEKQMTRPNHMPVRVITPLGQTTRPRQCWRVLGWLPVNVIIRLGQLLRKTRPYYSPTKFKLNLFCRPAVQNWPIELTAIPCFN